ncbi:MAG: hypothetical protein QW734_09485 [Candidatus Bathyarchaeia archaeon]
MGRRVGDLDFTDFPDDITLEHGKEKNGEREWWEYWKGHRGIVIQRLNSKAPFFIFFIEGNAVRTYKMPEIRAFKDVKDAVKELEAFGFKIRLKKACRGG